jgi:hypothetical protein
LLLNKLFQYVFICEMIRGKGRRPGASSQSGQALEKAQNGNGRLLEKVGMDLGLAPRPLGVGATSAWVWGTMLTVNATGAVRLTRPREGRRIVQFAIIVGIGVRCAPPSRKAKTPESLSTCSYWFNWL